LWHAVFHPGAEPRYCLITSWESGPELGSYIDKYNGVSFTESAPISPASVDEAAAIVAQRRADRAAALAAQGQNATTAEVKSEA
jgi:hypothetical protein